MTCDWKLVVVVPCAAGVQCAVRVHGCSDLPAAVPTLGGQLPGAGRCLHAHCHCHSARCRSERCCSFSTEPPPPSLLPLPLLSLMSVSISCVTLQKQMCSACFSKYGRGDGRVR